MTRPAATPSSTEATALPGPTGTCAASASDRARNLSPTASICAAVGADEYNAFGLAQCRERGALRQKAVAGMDGVGFRRQCGMYDSVDFEIALAGASGADTYRTIGETRGQAVAIRGGGCENRFDLKLPARANNARGDFSTIGDEDTPDGHAASLPCAHA